MKGLAITSISLTREATAEIMETAVTAGPIHGIGYWAEVVSLDLEKAELIINDIEADELKSYTLTTEDVHKGILAMFNDEDMMISAGKLLDDDLDGPLADVVIQASCFGKLLYG